MNKWTMLIFLFLLCNSVFSQEDSTSNKLGDEVVILDTILFKGMLVLDQVNKEVYFIEQLYIPKFNSIYKSNKAFLSDFKKVTKLNFLESNHLKLLLLEYTDFDCKGESNQLHTPQTNGIAVFKSGEDAIYVSLLSLSLVKARVKKSVLVRFYGNSYLRNQPDDFIITYSFLRCGW